MMLSTASIRGQFLFAASTRPAPSWNMAAARVRRSIGCRALLAAVVLVLAATSRLSAADPAPPAAAADETTPAAPTRAERRAAAKAASQRVTRADLAAAYLRMEQAYLAHPPTGERNAEVNRAFDQATLDFFRGKNAEAVRALAELALSLRPAAPTPVVRALVSLKVVIEPQVWTQGPPQAATARVLSIYEPPLEAPLDLSLTLRLVGPDGQVAFQRPVQVRVGPGSEVDQVVPLELPADLLKAGVYRVELAAAQGSSLSAGQISVIAGPSLGEQRVANEQRLAAIEPGDESLALALTSCRARNALLQDQLSTANSAQFLADFDALSRDVAAEVQLLEMGKDPYYRRAGDYWSVISGGGGEIPLRIFAPPAAASDAPAPLLIVLHGAGGDENMFFEGYGAGIIKQIADQKGLLIVSPSTNKFGGDPKNLDRLIAALSRHYHIDRQRIYVLGHSMGAGATAALARARPETIAAACCIAGGGSYQSKTGISPMLAIVAELDAVIPAKGLQSSAEKAAAAGAPVELRLMPGFGHTLVVGTVLPGAVDWLLEHSLPPPAGK